MQNYILENGILKLSTTKLGKLKSNEVTLKHSYIGLNFYDIDIVRGLIKKKSAFVPGIEAVGTIQKIGSDVKNFRIGERVVYCTAHNGAYATTRNISEDLLIFIPDNISDKTACALTLRGVMAHMLLRKVYITQAGSYILIYNPTGALGYILSQFAAFLNCKIIGVVTNDSNNMKKKIAQQYGCDLIIDHEDEYFSDKILEFTKGKGVSVIYDSIGNLNFNKSINIMQYCGLYVSLGQNSGTNLKVSMQRAMEKSIFITRPSLFEYKELNYELRLTAAEIYEALNKNIIGVKINKIYDFENLLDAHHDLINRNANLSNVIKI